jgi:hypothetical protein
MLGIGGSPLHPNWYKTIKSTVTRHPLGIIRLFKTDEDNEPVLHWGYCWNGKVHWGKYGATILPGNVGGYSFSDILPGGKLRHGDPYFNTIDTHVASEGTAIRTMGTGGNTTTDFILILGMVALGGLMIYVFYTQNQQIGQLQYNMTQLYNQMQQNNDMLRNLTAIFHG